MHCSTRITSGWLVTAALLVGCGGGGNGGGAEPTALPDVDVPTQEQADAAADQQMNDQNADEVMQELDKELDAELYGDG